uniref:Mechanosensitive ion channel MscS domain-containing protein n=1 Tax=Chromera velia CCMP2878 TaxID=1169474 RepID=A0A0G4HFX7_9ALVE|eukprot:Cvel_27051.t1-p1 / transcript=Cvel_27051.t1 / gene=Cvel_27051 / organism=Chromera_velia_CCMP2878 / gene_product=Mechanosensitive ion channel protein 10, putative / transcript_product=Mechanosensitive ion channel protein 10, putative / location=Cvel_scaffold3311:2326-10653(+) / protein_length=1258 / sequence_SO=supercontig / SO=protein_coding / is_pseudo=false
MEDERVNPGEDDRRLTVDSLPPDEDVGSLAEEPKAMGGGGSSPNAGSPLAEEDPSPAHPRRRQQGEKMRSRSRKDTGATASHWNFKKQRTHPLDDPSFVPSEAFNSVSRTSVRAGDNPSSRCDRCCSILHINTQNVIFFLLVAALTIGTVFAVTRKDQDASTLSLIIVMITILGLLVIRIGIFVLRLLLLVFFSLIDPHRESTVLNAMKTVDPSLWNCVWALVSLLMWRWFFTEKNKWRQNWLIDLRDDIEVWGGLRYIQSMLIVFLLISLKQLLLQIVHTALAVSAFRSRSGELLALIFRIDVVRALDVFSILEASVGNQKRTRLSFRPHSRTHKKRSNLFDTLRIPRPPLNRISEMHAALSRQRQTVLDRARQAARLRDDDDRPRSPSPCAAKRSITSMKPGKERALLRQRSVAVRRAQTRGGHSPDASATPASHPAQVGAPKEKESTLGSVIRSIELFLPEVHSKAEVSNAERAKKEMNTELTWLQVYRAVEFVRHGLLEIVVDGEVVVLEDGEDVKEWVPTLFESLIVQEEDRRAALREEEILSGMGEMFGSQFKIAEVENEDPAQWDSRTVSSACPEASPGVRRTRAREELEAELSVHDPLGCVLAEAGRRREIEMDPTVSHPVFFSPSHTKREKQSRQRAPNKNCAHTSGPTLQVPAVEGRKRSRSKGGRGEMGCDGGSPNGQQARQEQEREGDLESGACTEGDGDRLRELSFEAFKSYLTDGEARQLLMFMDPTGGSSVTKRRFIEFFLSMISERQSLVRTLESQEGMADIVRSLLNALLWIFVIAGSVIAFLGWTMLSGWDWAAIITGFGASTFFIVNASRNFVDSLVFVFFHHPFDLEDRVQLPWVKGGLTAYVKKISPMNTTFMLVSGEAVIVPNTVLATSTIINEARSWPTAFFLILKMSVYTEAKQVAGLNKWCRQYMEARPDEWNADGYFAHFWTYHLGEYMHYNMFIPHRYAWHRWELIFPSFSAFLLDMTAELNRLGIRYILPTQPVSFLPSSSVNGALRDFPANQNPFQHQTQHQSHGPHSAFPDPTAGFPGQGMMMPGGATFPFAGYPPHPSVPPSFHSPPMQASMPAEQGSSHGFPHHPHPREMYSGVYSAEYRGDTEERGANPNPRLSVIRESEAYLHEPAPVRSSLPMPSHGAAAPSSSATLSGARSGILAAQGGEGEGGDVAESPRPTTPPTSPPYFHNGAGGVGPRPDAGIERDRERERGQGGRGRPAATGSGGVGRPGGGVVEGGVGLSDRGGWI